ncbi:MAG: hypothetical protein ABJB05_07535 [Parafilimonas sp.]
MKHTIITLLLIIIFANTASSQQKPKDTANKNNPLNTMSYQPNEKDNIDKSNATDTTPHHSLLQAILDSLSKSLTPVKPTEKNARIAYEFRQFRIYPSEDALEVLYILNPWLANVQGDIPASRPIKMPDFPTLGKEKRIALRNAYKAALKPDPSVGVLFDSLADIFNQLTPDIQQPQQTGTGGLRDKLSQKTNKNKLAIIKTKIIPNLERSITAVRKAEADYINASFAELVNNLRIENISEDDLAAVINGFLIASSYSYYVDVNTNDKESSLAYNSKKSVFLFSRLIQDEIKKTDAPLGTTSDVIKCRIFIYNPQGQVISKRFDVYFRPFITTYSLKYCKTYSDTTGYIGEGSWNANAVSPCAVTIPNNSNWAIYFDDPSYKHVYTTGTKYNFQNLSALNGDENSDFYRLLIVYHGK